MGVGIMVKSAQTGKIVEAKSLETVVKALREKKLSARDLILVPGSDSWITLEELDSLGRKQSSSSDNVSLSAQVLLISLFLVPATAIALWVYVFKWEENYGLAEEHKPNDSFRVDANEGEPTKKAPEQTLKDRLGQEFESALRFMLKDPGSLQLDGRPQTFRIVARPADTLMYGNDVVTGMRCYATFCGFTATNAFGGRVYDSACRICDENGSQLCVLANIAKRAGKVTLNGGDVKDAFLCHESRFSDEWNVGP